MSVSTTKDSHRLAESASSSTSGGESAREAGVGDDRVIDLEAERRKRRQSSSDRPYADDDERARKWLDGLMRSHGDRLGRYFAVRLRSDDDARDLVIETFYQAWKSRHTFRGDSKSSTWLWTIGRRVLAKHFEKRSRRDGEVLTDSLPERSETPELAAQRTRRRALLECLAQLNERIQRSAELVWLLGHTYVEAAEILDEASDAVRMRLKRARQPLQKCLAERDVFGVSS